MSGGGAPEPSDPAAPRPHPPGRGKARPLAGNPLERIRESLQYLLDTSGDGWQLAHYVVVFGLQRVDSDGRVANAAWMAAPLDQADYITDGLLSTAEMMRAAADDEDDD